MDLFRPPARLKRQLRLTLLALTGSNQLSHPPQSMFALFRRSFLAAAEAMSPLPACIPASTRKKAGRPVKTYDNPSHTDLQTMKRNSGRRRNYVVQQEKAKVVHALQGLSVGALLTHGPGAMPGLGTELAFAAQGKRLLPLVQNLCQLAPSAFKAPLKRFFCGKPSGKPHICSDRDMAEPIADYQEDRHAVEEEEVSGEEEQRSWEEAGEELKAIFAKQRAVASREYITDDEKTLMVEYAKKHLVLPIARLSFLKIVIRCSTAVRFAVIPSRCWPPRMNFIMPGVSCTLSN